MEENCIFNCGVLCDKKNQCLMCGWNPQVHNERVREWRAKHAEANKGEVRQVFALV